MIQLQCLRAWSVGKCGSGGDNPTHYGLDKDSDHVRTTKIIHTTRNARSRKTRNANQICSLRNGRVGTTPCSCGPSVSRHDIQAYDPWRNSSIHFFLLRMFNRLFVSCHHTVCKQGPKRTIAIFIRGNFIRALFRNDKATHTDAYFNYTINSRHCRRIAGMEM